MSFFIYLIVGGVMYVAGTLIFLKRIKPHKHNKNRLPFQDKRLVPYMMGCFLVALGLSAWASLSLLGHERLDITYVLVNSVVMTVVFYFGLNPDETQMKLPD